MFEVVPDFDVSNFNKLLSFILSIIFLLALNHTIKYLFQIFQQLHLLT